VAKVLYFVPKEETFLELQPDPSRCEQTKDFIQVLEVFLFALREHNNVVQVDEASSPTNTGKDNVKSALEGRWGIS